MLMCFPGGNVALHKEWARASLIIASPSKPQRPKVPPGAAASAPLETCGRGSVLCAQRAARSGWRKGPKRHPDPKQTPARSGTAPEPPA